MARYVEAVQAIVRRRAIRAGIMKPDKPEKPDKKSD
jgi:hypothetical protein